MKKIFVAFIANDNKNDNITFGNTVLRVNQLMNEANGCALIFLVKADCPFGKMCLDAISISFNQNHRCTYQVIAMTDSVDTINSDFDTIVCKSPFAINNKGRHFDYNRLVQYSDIILCSIDNEKEQKEFGLDNVIKTNKIIYPL